MLDGLVGVLVLGRWGGHMKCWLWGLGGFGWEKVNLLRGIFVSSSYIVLF